MKPIRMTLTALIAMAALVLRPWTRYRRVSVTGRSMEPALCHGDYLVMRRNLGNVAPHDVVLLRSRSLLKRVIAMPHQEVTIDGGVIAIDGLAYEDPWWSGATRPDGRWALGADQFFVLGDNRAVSSQDSRSIGPVSRSAIEAVAVFRYWPAGRIGRLRGVR